MNLSKPPATTLKIIAVALGVGLGAACASAQTILEVGGGGVIGDETLASNDLAVTDPMTYHAPQHTFELDAGAKTADRYAPVAAGDAINLNGADLVVKVLTGELEVGDTYSLFDLSGGTTLTGSLGSISLPGGAAWDVSNLAAGGDGTITLLHFAGFQLLQRDLINGSLENLHSTTQAEAILALEAPNQQYDYIDTRVLRNTINVAGSGSFGGTDLLPNGLATSDFYVLHAQTYVMIPAGEWTIGFGSDDGGSLILDDITFQTKINSIGGANEVRFWGTRSHQWTFGTFTLTKPLVTTLDAIMFQASGGDSWEIAIFEGHTSGFDADTWVLLEDGAKGWSVVWADVFPPMIDSTVPANDETGAFVSGMLTATFNEEIVLTGNGTITLDHRDGGSDITIPLPDSRVTVSGRTLSINPGTNLDFETNYAVRISEDAIIGKPNPVANAFPGIDDTTTWNFTTVVEDATPPIIVSVDPDGTTVLPNVSLTITFDEKILLGGSSPFFDLLYENFDQDHGGFTVEEATNTSWEHGIPDSVGPKAEVVTDNGGTGGQCWGTQLGDYSGSADPGYYTGQTSRTRLRSPVIDLTGVEFTALSFAEANDVEPNYDIARVHLIDAETDVIIGIIYRSVNEDPDNAFWAPANGGRLIDLTAGVGKQIKIEWFLLGRAIYPPEYAHLGWYIDDVRVVQIDPSASIILKNLDTGSETAIPITDTERIAVNGNVLTISGILLDPAANYAVQIGSNAIRNYSDVSFAGIADDTTWAFATENATILMADGSWCGGEWSNGTPQGEIITVIPPGVTATYSTGCYNFWQGALILEEEATMSIWTSSYINPLNGATEIILKDGATINDNFITHTFHQKFYITGTAGMACTNGNGERRDRIFNGEISGGTWVTNGRKNQGYTYNTANTFAAYEVRSSNSHRHGVAFNAPGAAGHGNVTVSGGGESAVIILGADDVFSDTCVLTLNGKGWNNTPYATGETGPYASGPWAGTRMRIFMGTYDATVSELWVDGVQRAARSYTGADAEWIGGSGTLTVLNGPNDTDPPTLAAVDIVDDVDGGPVIESSTITYTVTFSKPVDDLTVDVGDFENGGTAAVNIDSVSTNIHTGVVTVVVTSLSPGGAGTLILRLAADADIRDFAGNPVDTTSAVDDTIITIYADVTPPMVETLRPVPGETGVNAQPDLVIDFIEETGIVRGTGAIEIRDSQDHSVLQSYDVATAPEVGFIGTTQVVIDLNATLGFNREVYVHIPPGAFKDYSQNAFGGITDPAEWSFTTGIVPPRAGPLSLLSASVAGEQVTTTEFVHTFDTIPRLSVSHDLAGAGEIALSAGRHLVIYNSRFDSSGGSNRSEIQTHLNLAGVDLSAGWSQGFIRRFGSYEAITAGGAIIEADEGDILRLQSFRSDTNSGASVVRADAVTNSTSAHGDPGPIPGENGATALQLLKLDDGWPCLRLAGHDGSYTNQGLSQLAIYNEVRYYTVLERSNAVFGLGSGPTNITFHETAHYLVLANTYANGEAFSDRVSVAQYLTLDGIEIPGSRTNVYIRNVDGAFQGAASLGMIIRASAGQVLNVRAIKEYGRGGGFIEGTRTALSIVQLPASAEVLRLTDDTGQDINTSGVLQYGTRLGDLPVSFSHDTATFPSRVGVTTQGDYLFLATHFVPSGDHSNNRRMGNQGWQINGSHGFSAYGQTGRYNRHSLATHTAGNWSGFMTRLSAGDFVETVTRPLAASGSDSANLALQAVSIDSLFTVTPPPTLYSDWIALYPGVGALDSFGDDPDGDGIANGIENYFGTDPGNFSAGISEVQVNSNTVTFRHQLNANPADDVAGAYLWSDDLVTFHADGADNGLGTTLDFIQGTPLDGMVDVTATISGPVPAKLFITIKVTQVTP